MKSFMIITLVLSLLLRNVFLKKFDSKRSELTRLLAIANKNVKNGKFENSYDVRNAYYKNFLKNENCQTSPKTFPGIDWIPKGYNIFQANPFLSDSSQVIDPGIMEMNIFKVKLDNNKTTDDMLNYSPKGWIITNSFKCDFDSNVNYIKSSKDINDLFFMITPVKVDNNNPSKDDLVQLNFNMRNIFEKVSNYNIDYYISQKICSVYTVTLDTKTPELEDTFIDDLKSIQNLEFNTNTYDQYYKFLKKYGTHYPTKMEMGSKFSIIAEKSSTNVSESIESSENLKIKVNVLIAEISTNISHENKSKSETKNYFSNYNYRSIGAPLPLNFNDENKNEWASATRLGKDIFPVVYNELIFIYDLLNYHDVKKQLLQKSINVNNLYNQLKLAIDKYCDILIMQKEITSCTNQYKIKKIEKYTDWLVEKSIFKKEDKIPRDQLSKLNFDCGNGYALNSILMQTTTYSCRLKYECIKIPSTILICNDYTSSSLYPINYSYDYYRLFKFDKLVECEKGYFLNKWSINFKKEDKDKIFLDYRCCYTQLSDDVNSINYIIDEDIKSFEKFEKYLKIDIPNKNIVITGIILKYNDENKKEFKIKYTTLK